MYTCQNATLMEISYNGSNHSYTNRSLCELLDLLIVTEIKYLNAKGNGWYTYYYFQKRLRVYDAWFKGLRT